MILVILVISAIALLISFVYTSRNSVRLPLTIVFGLLLVGSVVFISKNDNQHYGMVKTTTTKTSKLASVSENKQLNLLLYQSVGSADKHRVYVYKQTASQKKTQHTKADVKVTNRVKTSQATPKLVTKTTRWTYKSNAMKFWFGIAGNDHELISTRNTFYVNADWAVLSSSQAKTFSKLMKQQQATLKARAKVYVQNQVKAAMTKDPTMSQAEITKVSKAAAAQYQQNAVKSLLQQVKAND